MTERVCINCKKSLEGKRRSAKFCSDYCRYEHHNKNKCSTGKTKRKKKLRKQANNKNNKDINSYQVYAAMDSEGNYLYIGSGLAGRELHCTSGTSHNYDLNRLHHTGKDITIHILHSGLSKPQSMLLELNLIEKYRPVCNKQYLKRKGVYGKKYKIETQYCEIY